MTGNISAKADKAAAKKPKKVSKYSKRKVDPAFYWMTTVSYTHLRAHET